MDPHDRAPDPRQLLADYRDRDRLPATTREAAWQRLQIALQHPATPDRDPLATAPQTDTPTPSIEKTSLPRNRRRNLTILLAAALALLFIGLGQLLGSRRHAERDNQSQHLAPDPIILPTTTPGPLQLAHDRSPHHESTPEDRTAPNSPQSPDPTQSTAPTQSYDLTQSPDPSTQSPDPTQPPAPADPSTQSPAPEKSPQTRKRPPRDLPPIHDPARGLDAELSLLRRARAALTDAPQQALDLLGEHARRFPAGHLAEERMLLRVQALCAVGQTRQARAAADRFVRVHPGSPHASTIAAACRE